MGTLNVSNQTELTNALNIAVAADEIHMAAGTYGSSSLSNKTFATPVIVKLTGNVSLQKFQLTNVDGFTFDFDNGSGGRHQVQFTHPSPADSTKIFQVDGCSNIKFLNCDFKGIVQTNPASTGNLIGYGWMLGLNTNDTVLVGNCVFTDTYRHIVFGNSMQNLTITNCDFSESSADSIQGSSVHGLTIRFNLFHDRHYGGGSVHRDMIQMDTTNHSVGEISRDILISDNIFDVRDGAWSQTIFMRNLAVDTNAHGTGGFYQNITIEDNLIINGHGHGITVGATNNLTIQRNTMLLGVLNTAINDGVNDGRVGTAYEPRISLSRNDAPDLPSTNVTIRDNVYPEIGDGGDYAWGTAGLVFENNEVLRSANYAAQLDNFPSTYTAGPNEPTVKVGSAIDIAQAGYPPMLPGGAPALPTLGNTPNMNVTVGAA